MNTATITIKTSSETEAKAQKLAGEKGISLSILMDDVLKTIVKAKKDTAREARHFVVTRDGQVLVSSAVLPAYDASLWRSKTLEDLYEKTLIRWLLKFFPQD